MARQPRNATKPLRRAEAKELTRRRLLNAAVELMNERDGSRLSVSAICRRAGIAQSSFYVHFNDLSHLLFTLGEETAVRRTVAVREARRQVREHRDAAGVRETFRIPLVEMVENSDEYRMTLRARYDLGSPLGEVMREMQRREREDLVEDLELGGLVVDTPTQKRRASMLADCLGILTEVLALGYVDGRYGDLDEILDVLVQIFFFGVASFFPPESRLDLFGAEAEQA